MRKNIRQPNTPTNSQVGVSLMPQAKIYRANILCRILNALTVTKKQQSFLQIQVTSRNNQQKKKKVCYFLNSLIRSRTNQLKFTAFYKLKRNCLSHNLKDIQANQQNLINMSKGATNIICYILRTKKKNIMKETLQTIKTNSNLKYHQQRTNQRKGLRKIQQILIKNQKWAFNKITTSLYIVQKNRRIKRIGQLLKSKYKQNLQWVLWKLTRNSLFFKKQQLKQDIITLQQKIKNDKDPQKQALIEKRQKLMQHVNKIRKQKQDFQKQFQEEVSQIQTQKLQLSERLTNLENGNMKLQEQIVGIYQEINAPYSMDQIYQMLYNSFLLYVHENKDQVYDKEKILNALTTPLIPIQIPLQSIKQQNQVMSQLLHQYKQMYGPKKIQQNMLEITYQYLIKQNQAMHRMLLTLLPQVNNQKQDLEVLSDSVAKLSAKVNQIWGE